MLEITDVTDKEVTFKFDHIKSGRMILFTAEKAKFTSANTAVYNFINDRFVDESAALRPFITCFFS